MLFGEAVRVFCDHLPDPVAREAAAEVVGRIFQYSKEQVAYHVNERSPLVHSDGSVLTVGRNRLPIASSAGRLTYCATRQSANLLDFLATSVSAGQSALLVGETGVGKTSAVQYLASVTARPLRVVNLCEQSESSDLFGGFKPVDFGFCIAPIVQEFKALCTDTYSEKKNRSFLATLANLNHAKKWTDLVAMMSHVADIAVMEKKKSKFELTSRWSALRKKLRLVSDNVSGKSGEGNVFAYVDGVLTSAMRAGEWVLLDEINLAEQETLMGLSAVLNRSDSSFRLNDEAGSVVHVHPEFRIFACMNPSTDVGKKDLPPSLRSRFAEFFLGEPTNRRDLELIVKEYLKELDVPDKKVLKIVEFYAAIRKLCRDAFNSPFLVSICNLMLLFAETVHLHLDTEF